MFSQRHVYLVVGSSPPRPPDAPSQVESEEAGPGGDVERFQVCFQGLVQVWAWGLMLSTTELA